MTDAYLTEPDDNDNYIVVRFRADRTVFAKLETAAATQAMTMTTAINTAMQHYELTLSAPPGKVLRFKDADDQQRRIWMVPTNSSRWEKLMLLAMGAAIASGPLILASRWFYLLWVAAVLAFVISWIAIKVET